MHIGFIYCSALSFSLNDTPWEYSLSLISSNKTIVSPLLEGPLSYPLHQSRWCDFMGGPLDVGVP